MNFQGNRVHCVGIGGAGVQALAEFLARSGALVTGSDEVESEATERLRLLGIRVFCGHDACQVPVDAECLVYSPAVRPENVERQRARERAIPEYSYPEMLGRLMLDRQGIAIAGTHGKGTTTAMVGWILTQAGLDPTVIVGANVPQLGGPSRVGHGRPFVAESCEFARSFHHARPQVAAVLNIEPEHLDYYRGLDEIIESFAGFVELVPPGGLIVARGACSAVSRAIRSARGRVETFSLEPGSTWWAADLRGNEGRYRFRVFRDGEYVTQIALRVPGTHNVENALAAVALTRSLGVPTPAVREAIEDFRGCGRRFEFRGSWRGVTLVDDYAHHPTEVRATLGAAREMYPGRRIWCIFQPHQLARTRALVHEFAGAFGSADRVVIAGIYAARERAGELTLATGLELAAAIEGRGTPARHLPRLEQVIEHLENHLEPADVLLTMGAGDIWKVADAFARRLSRHRQAG